MERRHFLKTTQLACLGMVMARDSFNFINPATGTKITVLNITNAGDAVKLPEDSRIPFDWPAIGIQPGSSIILNAPKLPKATSYWLRVSVAQEMRDEKFLHVSIPGAGIELGTIKILYSSVLVPYELEIPSSYAETIKKNGIGLRLESAAPLWIFSQKAQGIDNAAFLPHILGADKKKGDEKQLLNCLSSVNSIQSFGWREGAVLDGLWQLAEQKKDARALKAISTHFDLYFHGTDLKYETGRGKSLVNEISGIESTLPYATLAQVSPRHPMLNVAVKGLLNMKQPNGVIMDNEIISAEGCYTVAYPLAVIGKKWNDQNLVREAISQLQHRFVLHHDNALCLRYGTNGAYTFKNWARGAAWFLLGFVRTMSELKDHAEVQELKGRFAEAVKLVASLQQKDGLWACFMDKPDTLPDTSGSAGIGAAIATGMRENFIPATYRQTVDNCWQGLLQYITPDGFLKGVAQDNRGGRKLQEGDYRVIGQMGMGMMAQLAAEL